MLYNNFKNLRLSVSFRSNADSRLRKGWEREREKKKERMN